MYKLSKEEVLSKDLIVKYLSLNAEEEARQTKLHDYYKANHAINRRELADPSKPNNKIVNPYPHYISDMMVGYFMGEPVQYSSNDEELHNTITAIFNYNDEAANNAELATDASIFGVAYEIMYLDADAQIRFKRINPVGCIPIYEDDIEGDLLYFIRHYETRDILNNTTVNHVEVYSRESVTYYTNNTGILTMVEEVPHSWGLVPINIYQNNKEEMGDFETVISLIDAFDKLESDSVNDTEYHANAYMVLKGMEGTDADDVAAMKEQRVLLLPDDGSAEWLTKTINDAYLENMKARIDADIHKFSYCPALTDKDFAANASGVAMKYKLMGLENAVAKKERAFKVGLQRRLEQICNFLNIIGGSYDYRAVNMIFSRNIPVNVMEMADVVNKVGHLYSEKTQMAMLPIEVDYEAEEAQKQAEQESGYSNLFEMNGNV